MKKAWLYLTMMAMLVLLTSHPGLAAVWFVDRSYSGVETGTSWASPFNHIQDALDVAAPFDEIWVKGSQAYNYELTSPLLVTNPVGLYAGFNGTETARNQRDWTLNKTAIDGQHVVQNCMQVTANAIIDGFIIVRGGFPGLPFGDKGGGIYIQGAAPTLQNCRIRFNRAGSGGGLYSLSSKPLLKNCTFLENIAHKGGAIYSTSSSMTLKDCTFKYNETPSEGGSGGGMYIEGSKASLNNCLFESNDTIIEGGAITGYSSSFTCKRSRFEKNVTAARGGAIYINQCEELTLDQCDFFYNGRTPSLSKRTNWGGAIYNEQSRLLIFDCNFKENQCDRGGGAIYASWADNSLIRDSLFTRNLATDDSFLNNGGGAIIQTGKVLIKGCEFGSNKVGVTNLSDDASMIFDTKGGAIRNLPSENGPTIDTCRFNGNAAYHGGAIFDTDANSTIISCRFSENTATRGGAINYEPDSPHLIDSRAFLGNSTFTWNMAHENGGAVYNDGAVSVIAHCSFYDNSCSYYGGAIRFVGDEPPWPFVRTIYNSIFWGNNSSFIPCEKEVSASMNADPDITYCDIDHDFGEGCSEHPYLGLEGNMWENPLFDGFGLHLRGDSPCLDAGLYFSPYFLKTDYEGDPRVVGTAPDMGADEFLLRVEIDIMPGICPNIYTIGEGSTVLPVAILGEEDFNVASEVNLNSVRLVYGDVELSPDSDSISDLSQPVDPDDRKDVCDCPERGGDGRDDLILGFGLTELLPFIGDTNRTRKVVLSVTGETNQGVPFRGRDCLTVKIIKRAKRGR